MSCGGRPVNRPRNVFSARLTGPFSHPAAHLGEGCLQRGTVFAAALGEIRSTAALAADPAGDLRQQLTRLDPARRGTADARHQRRLASVGAGQHHDDITQLLLETVHRVPQGPGVEPFDPRGHDLQSGNIDSTRGQVRRRAAGRLGLERVELALELLLTIEQRTHAVADIGRSAAEQAGGLAQALFLGVWPGNAWMAWRWRRRPWPAQLVSLGRLPLQVPLIRAAGRVARS